MLHALGLTQGVLAQLFNVNLYIWEPVRGEDREKKEDDDDRGPASPNGQPSAGVAMFTSGKPEVTGRWIIDRNSRGDGGLQATVIRG